MGQCSLTVALPIISACGVETVILPSAVLSTHTGGFTGYTFRDLTEDIPGIMGHWMKEGLKFDCLYTGYLGSVLQIEYVGQLKENVLYLSEESFEADFSAQRALSRNRVIHAMAEKVLVAQCTLKKGGTWDGTVTNLFGRFSPVYCFDDGSEAVLHLEQMGAQRIGLGDLSSLSGLSKTENSLFDQC